MARAKKPTIFKNIEILNDLNVGLESAIFIDDSDFELSEGISEICCHVLDIFCHVRDGFFDRSLLQLLNQ